MPELIKTKLRRIGTSFGFLVPKETLANAGIKEGEEIEIAIFKKNLKLLEEAFGSAKNAKFKFVRDKRNRV